MPTTITVRSTLPEGRVALFETHPDHPAGEIFVAGDGTFEVAETSAVLDRLARGWLAKVESAAPEPAKAPAPKGPLPRAK